MTEFALSIPELEDSVKETLFDFFSCNERNNFVFLKSNLINISFHFIPSGDEALHLKSEEYLSGIEFALILQSFLNHYKLKTPFTFLEIDDEHCQTLRYVVTRQQIISLPSSGYETCYETSDEEIKMILCREFVSAYENLQKFNNDEDQTLKDVFFYLQKRHGTDNLKEVFRI